jgi:hypothetical protein
MRNLRRCGLSIIGAAVMAALMFGPAVAAQGDPLSEAVEPPGANGLNPVNDAAQREKERRVLAGMAAIAGIVIAGVALITLIILWAGRLRRLSRQPLPSSNVRNEFWFLRPPKPPVSERGPDDG